VRFAYNDYTDCLALRVRLQDTSAGLDMRSLTVHEAAALVGRPADRDDLDSARAAVDLWVGPRGLVHDEEAEPRCRPGR
jgi:hypothetical protein